jgi:hypothetical protein
MSIQQMLAVLGLVRFASQFKAPPRVRCDVIELAASLRIDAKEGHTSPSEYTLQKWG